MVGRPDVLRLDEVIDSRSGGVHDEEDHEQVRSSYVRHLRLHAFLAMVALGGGPAKVLLCPGYARLSRSRRILVFGQEANDAIRLLDDYNTLVSKGVDCHLFASPSPHRRLVGGVLSKQFA